MRHHETRAPRYRWNLAGFAVMTLALATGALADPGDERWSAEFDRPGPNGRAFALATWNGQLVAGGYQTWSTDGQDIPYLATYDGSEWTGIGGGTNGAVRGIATYGTDLVVVGEFGLAGGVPAQGIARWDGTQWHAFGSGLEHPFALWPLVFDVVVFQGDLYAAGMIASADGVPVANIARWDGTQWHDVGGGVDGPFEPKVLDLLVHDDRLYVCGEFDQAGPIAANNIAVWDGASWNALGAGLDGNLISVFAMEAFQGDLYATGNFGLAGGQPVDKIARWDGAQWHDVGGGLQDWDISVTGYSLETFGEHLYVGGNFIQAGSVYSSRVIRWTGAAWESIGGVDGQDLATTVIAMAEHAGQLYIGGEFEYGGSGPDIDGYTVSASVIAFDGVATWSPAGLGLGFRGAVADIVAYDNGLVAVGSFLSAGSALAVRVAHFDGTDWQTMGHVSEGNVKDAIVFEGDLIITGNFTQIDGQAISGTARYDGTQWQSMTGGGGSALEIHDGQLYGAGLGQPRRWNGTSWEIVGPSGTIFGQVEDMISYGGNLVICGSIGPTVDNVAVWDGQAWSSLGGGFDQSVESLAIYQGDLIAAGWFTQADGSPARSIVRWDGTQWTQLGSGLGNNVTSLFTVGDQLFVSGGFNYLVGDPIDYIGYWDGADWQPMGSGVNFPAAAWFHDATAGLLYVGGGFDEAGGVPAFSMSTWTLEEVTSAPGNLGFGADGVVMKAPYPNPFTGATSVAFTLPSASRVEAGVYDVAGRRVATLLSGVREAGRHALHWDGLTDGGGRAASGVYFLQVRTPEAAHSRKVIRLR